MTRLLLLGAVLLLPLAAQAGEFDLTGQPRITLGCIDGFIDDPVIHQCVPYPDPCLATMEAAMRAMEPWTYVAVELGKGKLNYYWQLPSPITPNEAEMKGLTVYKDARKQWADAKRCWKNQP